jgi:alpha-beta hydrolase superfamily lysophospholipase
MRYVLIASLLNIGCIADLDVFKHNPRHCSVVGVDTCEDIEEVMDKICTKCAEDYPFAERGMPVDRVTKLTFQSDGVENDAYFVKAAEDSALGHVTIIFAHGNYASIEHYLHSMEAIYGSGANLFAFEYPGYGQSSSESAPSETAFFANADAAYALLLSELASRNLQASDVVFFGMSLGALPSVHLAKQHSGATALILESPYPSASLFLEDSSATSIPASFILSGSYDNLEKIPDVTLPTLVMHSEGDDFIRVEHSDRLFEAMNEPKCFWRTTEAKHGVSNGIAVKEGYDRYAQIIGDWIANQTCPE